MAGGIILWMAWLGSVTPLRASEPEDLFNRGTNAFHEGRFVEAAQLFRDSATSQPTVGALLNLGLSEWRRGRAGAAIRAWEQTLWVDPVNTAARGNLAYARRLLDLQPPSLRWHERASAWLPINAWAWITGGSLWLTIGAAVMPGLVGRRKTNRHHALAALGLVAFLLAVPAHVGVATRTRIGFVLHKNAPLRLTPTNEAETLAKLASGEPARELRRRGNYVLLRTSQGDGWVERSQFGRICGD